MCMHELHVDGLRLRLRHMSFVTKRLKSARCAAHACAESFVRNHLFRPHICPHMIEANLCLQAMNVYTHTYTHTHPCTRTMSEMREPVFYIETYIFEIKKKTYRIFSDEAITHWCILMPLLTSYGRVGAYKSGQQGLVTTYTCISALVVS